MQRRVESNAQDYEARHCVPTFACTARVRTWQWVSSLMFCIWPYNDDAQSNDTEELTACRTAVSCNTGTSNSLLWRHHCVIIKLPNSVCYYVKQQAKTPMTSRTGPLYRLERQWPEADRTRVECATCTFSKRVISHRSHNSLYSACFQTITISHIHLFDNSALNLSTL